MSKIKTPTQASKFSIALSTISKTLDTVKRLANDGYYPTTQQKEDYDDLVDALDRMKDDLKRNSPDWNSSSCYDGDGDGWLASSWC